MYGKKLDDGKKRYKILRNTCMRLGDPVAKTLLTSQFIEYIDMRMESDGMTKGGVNREHAYLRAMYNTLIGLNEYRGKNPVAGIKAQKEGDVELTYYDKSQLEELFTLLYKTKSQSVGLVSEICASTGARWGEAESLHPRQIKAQRIQFYPTKNSLLRFVPISKELEDKLLSKPMHSKTRLFSHCYSTFQSVVSKSSLPSPRGQLTHVLRHSFAVRFMERKGNIVDLMRALGHQDIKTTSIYLRFAPKHLKDVVALKSVQ